MKLDDVTLRFEKGDTATLHVPWLSLDILFMSNAEGHLTIECRNGKEEISYEITKSKWGGYKLKNVESL